VIQSRRWDPDFLALRRAVDGGHLRRPPSTSIAVLAVMDGLRAVATVV
jgi:predicted dehydrogenase